MSLINRLISTEAFLAFTSKISGIIQEAVALMTIFAKELTAFSPNLRPTNGTFVF